MLTSLEKKLRNINEDDGSLECYHVGGETAKRYYRIIKLNNYKPGSQNYSVFYLEIIKIILLLQKKRRRK